MKIKTAFSASILVLTLSACGGGGGGGGGSAPTPTPQPTTVTFQASLDSVVIRRVNNPSQTINVDTTGITGGIITLTK